MNLDLSTCKLLHVLEGHILLVLGTNIFCEMPATTARSLSTNTKVNRIWGKKMGGKAIPKPVSGIRGRKFLEV